MQVPLEIAFHHVKKQGWAEAEIRGHVARLEKLFDRLTACRVRVDRFANKSTGTTPPVVRIELSVPGHRDIVVSHEPDHLMQRFQDPDLRNAINEAFRKAERQLLDFKEKLQGRTKVAQHDVSNQFLGQVAEMHADEDHGFLVTKEGGLLYFHRNSMLNGDFDKLRRGDRVHYVEEIGDTGPIAVKVRVAG
jgi:ribosome-associated translation inhibitor RaiA/cold shock CspA family protein